VIRRKGGVGQPGSRWEVQAAPAIHLRKGSPHRAGWELAEAVLGAPGKKKRQAERPTSKLDGDSCHSSLQGEPKPEWGLAGSAGCVPLVPPEEWVKGRPFDNVRLYVILVI